MTGGRCKLHDTFIRLTLLFDPVERLRSVRTCRIDHIRGGNESSVMTQNIDHPRFIRLSETLLARGWGCQGIRPAVQPIVPSFVQQKEPLDHSNVKRKLPDRGDHTIPTRVLPSHRTAELLPTLSHLLAISPGRSLRTSPSALFCFRAVRMASVFG